MTSGMPYGLVSQVKRRREDMPTRVHQQMLSVLRTHPGKGSRAERTTPNLHQRPMIDRLNVLMAHLLSRACRSLAALSASQCAFACEVEAHGGRRSRWTTTIDKIPVCVEQLAALRVIEKLSELRPDQQALVVRTLALEQDLRLIRIHQDFKHFDSLMGEVFEDPELERDAAKTSAELKRLRRSMSSAVDPWLLKHRGVIEELRNTSRITPFALHRNASSDELMVSAAWYQSLGEIMYLPLPLEEKANPLALSKWRRHWATYEECGKAVLVVAHWIRAFGTVNVHKRCYLCFRHQLNKIRCHCVIHKRTAQKRIPRREELVAKEYRKSVGATGSRNGGDVSFQQIMSEPAATGMVMAVDRLGLPTEISKPALELGTLLRWLHPMLSDRQRGLVTEQFDCMLRDCRRPFEVEVPFTAEARHSNKMLKTAALLKMSWTQFFGRVFASEAGADIAIGAGKGLPIDIGHPLASPHAVITQGKLINDLQRFRAWIEADFATDKLVYLDDLTVLGEFQRQKKHLGRNPSLRELGAVFGRAPTTISKALRRASLGNHPNPPRRRYAKR